MIKIIASDMDGTLINSNREISEENVNAIKDAISLGVKFVIATGRMFQDVKPFMDKYNIRCQYILMNGAEYRDEDGRLLRSINMDKVKVKSIIEKILTTGNIVEVYTNEGAFTPNTREEALREVIYRMQNFDQIKSFEEAKEAALKHEHFTNMKYIENLDEFLSSSIEIKKLITFNNNLDEISKLREELIRIPGLAVLSSFKNNLEITNEEAQKGLILKKVSKNYGFENNEVMALGDGLNDYSMFTEFEKAYAMENAVEEIKEIAKNITDTNDNDGVAKAIRKELNI